MLRYLYQAIAQILRICRESIFKVFLLSSKIHIYTLKLWFIQQLLQKYHQNLKDEIFPPHPLGLPLTWNRLIIIWIVLSLKRLNKLFMLQTYIEIYLCFHFLSVCCPTKTVFELFFFQLYLILGSVQNVSSQHICQG